MAEHRMSDQPWKTKLDRVGELAAKSKDTVFNNLLHLFDMPNLLETYRTMDGSKAVGVDGVTKEDYGADLAANLRDLIRRIRNGAYRPKPARVVEVPKEDGSTRPLAISCFEDKLVQTLASQILGRLYEPVFLPCSFGFRPGLGCHDALRSLRELVDRMKDGAVVEIDIRKYFNTIPHRELLDMLSKKISDPRFLGLIGKLMSTPTIENGVVTRNSIGCPQGSVVSPILANIYLHHVIDTWFAELEESHFQGMAGMVRFADDMVFVFANRLEAEKFFRVLPKRLEKFGLRLHDDKSQLLESGEFAALRAEKEGRKLGTYRFLGFVVYWGKSRNGSWRLKLKSRSDRLTAKLKGLGAYLRENLNAANSGKVLETAASIARGWVNYHAVSDNARRVNGFLFKCRWLIHKWYNRRGGHRYLTWERLGRILAKVNFPSSFKTISLFPPGNRGTAAIQ